MEAPLNLRLDCLLKFWVVEQFYGTIPNKIATLFQFTGSNLSVSIFSFIRVFFEPRYGRSK